MGIIEAVHKPVEIRKLNREYTAFHQGRYLDGTYPTMGITLRYDRWAGYNDRDELELAVIDELHDKGMLPASERFAYIKLRDDWYAVTMDTYLRSYVITRGICLRTLNGTTDIFWADDIEDYPFGDNIKLTAGKYWTGGIAQDLDEMWPDSEVILPGHTGDGFRHNCKILLGMTMFNTYIQYRDRDFFYGYFAGEPFKYFKRPKSSYKVSAYNPYFNTGIEVDFAKPAKDRYKEEEVVKNLPYRKTIRFRNINHTDFPGQP